MKRRNFLITAAAAALAPMGVRAQASFPSKPITWVVGFPPGGGADGVTRLVASKVSQNIGQPVVVENRPGASSSIAAQYVANAAPDGYTIMSVEQGSMVFNTALYSKLSYDPKDIAPVCDMIRAPVILAVNPNFPAKDLKSFIELIRRNPGKYNYGSPGRGLAHQLAMEAFKQRAKLDIVDVQYKGIAPVVQDVIAGQIPMGPIDTVVILPHLRAGKLRAIASFSDKRLAATPDVPAMGELGYEGLDIAPIVGVGAPAKTPREIIQRLNAEIVKAVRSPEVSAKLTGLGLEIIADTPEQFAAFLDNEGKKWLPLIRSLNIKLD
ncbi:MAG TPA: tripartite tricarboxylate transporter substrate binding protein [Burkholderiales bacterium]|nr:tripartite tricarboxylate transporter substrate binding protein [Burkholderiales bacterium]